MFPPRPPRAGVQIHAVPDSERAIDPTGRKLPWGYEYSTAPPPTTDSTKSRDPPLERGPFGRSMRRSRSGLSRSRSKTAEPRREEDRQRAENLVFEDNVFGALKKIGGGNGGKEEGGDGEGEGVGVKGVGAAVQTVDAEAEPTEVFLYGFGADTQWAAIDFYERVSNAVVLEDYPRTSSGAPHTARRMAGGSLSRAAMRKKNKFAGGEHWIKVTFSSREGAELAVARSPHVIKGYLVYCEPWTGRGPQRDEAVVATGAGAQITSDVLPVSFSTEDPFARRVGDGQEESPQSSNTASSATVTGGRMEGSEMQQVDRPPWSAPWGGSQLRNTQDSPAESSTLQNSSSTTSALDRQSRTAPVQRLTTAAPSSSSLNAPMTPRRSRIEGATRATVLPMEMALAPKAPKASWSSWLGAGEVLGSVVPRMEDGVTFDWERAGWYWRVVWLCDRWLGTEFLGGRDGE